MSMRPISFLSIIAAFIAAGHAMAAPPAAHHPKPVAAAKPKPASARKPSGVVTQAPAPAPRNNTWALLVGVSKYQNPAIVSLRYPASDATAIRDALVDRQL